MTIIEILLSLVALVNIDVRSVDDIVAMMQKAESDYVQKMQAAAESFKSEVNQARLKYIEERQKINQQLFNSLKEIRDTASKNVDLETANRAQKEIDALEKESIQPPAIQVQPKKMKRTFAGNWEGQWDNSNELKLQITENNVVHHILSEDNTVRARIETKNGRSLVINDKWQDFELIRQGDRLIVLGWTKDGKHHPMLNQPDHVAILFKKK